MTQARQIYLCEICGNLVEVLEGADGTLVCCGQNMTLQTENTKEASFEKHIPVTEIQGDRINVRVGSVPHPMEPTHFIEWIELIEDGRSQRADLSPNDAPEAQFVYGGGDFTVRAYCNLHGLWKNQ